MFRALALCQSERRILQTLYDGRFTYATQLTIPNYLSCYILHRRNTKVSLETYRPPLQKQQKKLEIN